MIRQALQQRQSAGNPIRVGASGAGWMGSGFVAQMRLVPGMEVVVLADSDVGAARQAFLDTGVNGEDIVEASAVGTAEDALRQGKRVMVKAGIVVAASARARRNTTRHETPINALCPHLLSTRPTSGGSSAPDPPRVPAEAQGAFIPTTVWILLCLRQQAAPARDHESLTVVFSSATI